VPYSPRLSGKSTQPSADREERASCELDHLISLELGSSNRLRNLWPEPYDIVWNTHVRDRLENRLYQMVCARQLASRGWISWHRR
jgi:hypothetical protein